MAAKKAAAKKAPTKKAAAKSDESCLYCGREAVGRNDKGSAVCETHRNRAESAGQEVSGL